MCNTDPVLKGKDKLCGMDWLSPFRVGGCKGDICIFSFGQQKRKVEVSKERIKQMNSFPLWSEFSLKPSVDQIVQ